MAQKQIGISKRPLEEQVADLQVRVACLEVAELPETAKAHAGWIYQLEERIKKLEHQPDDFVHQAVKAQAARIRQLEQQVRNLGGNPNEK